MNHRILTWGSTVLAIGGAVCSVVASRTQGTLSTALWVIGIVLLVIGIVGLSFSDKKDQKERAEKMAQEKAEERAALERAKYLLFLYAGKKKRLSTPTEKDHFSFEAYLTEDRAEVESYLDGSMPESKLERFGEDFVRSVWSLDISVKELSDLKGKVIFVSQSEYEVMRYSEAYRKFFANNEIVSL